MQRLAAHADKVESVRSDVKVAIELGESVELPGAQRKGKFNGILTAADESRLRVEVFSPLGAVAYIMAINGNTITALMPFSGEYARGDLSDPAITGPFAMLPVQLDELSDLARGVIPLREGARSEIEDEQGRGVLVIGDTQRVTFASEGGWPEEVWYADDSDRGDVVISFREYESVDGVALPTLIDVEAGSRGTATMTFKGIELNPQLAEDLFEIPAPPQPAPTPDSNDF